MSIPYIAVLAFISFASGFAFGYLVAWLRHDKPVVSRDDFRGPNFPP